MKLKIERRNIFVVLFVAIVAMAGFGQFTNSVDASTSSIANPNATIPPPGGTLPPNSAGFQLLHLAPFATDSDVNASIVGPNATANYSNVGLGTSTGAYLAVSAGPVNGVVTPVVGGPSYNFSETLVAAQNRTVAVVGGANGWPVGFLSLSDTTTEPSALNGKVRIVHAAPFATAPAINTVVNVVEQTDASINAAFEGLLYENVTQFIELPVGTYDWKVNLPSGSTLIDLPSFNLYSGAIVTIYLVGDGTVQQGAGLFTIQELGTEAKFVYVPVLQMP